MVGEEVLVGCVRDEAKSLVEYVSSRKYPAARRGDGDAVVPC